VRLVEELDEAVVVKVQHLEEQGAFVAERRVQARRSDTQAAGQIGDFGATVSWSAAMMRPDLFDAVFCLSVPPVLPGGPSMLERLKSAGRENDFCMFRQMRPEADREWADAATTLPGMLYWTSGLPDASEAWHPMNPDKSLNRPSPIGIPPFANREDVEAAIAGLERDDFHGPLNSYRASRRRTGRASSARCRRAPAAGRRSCCWSSRARRQG
jgi:pimeloyl-ACP methyl ester carboxylesterase